MSILKGILHHWNKTSSAYDTIHPETEYAQVTDWNKGIGATLASTALGGLVSTLTSDSLFATLLKKAMTALGVKYLAAQNGYVCLGDIFGRIIIQWGHFTETSAETVNEFNVSLPISCTTTYSVITAGTMDDSANIVDISNTVFTARCHRSMNTDSSYYVKRPFFWAAICKA
jgi:hypothetical protein